MLGEELVEVDAAILLDTDDGTWIRYSHSSVDAVADDAVAAVEALNAACAAAATQVVLQPGDLPIVSNRTALHGRAAVGGALGGASRWLMRGHGLNIEKVTEAKRNANSPHNAVSVTQAIRPALGVPERGEELRKCDQSQDLG